ncbi:MAG: hypothetical protein K0S38_227 [Candidatus Paceibacter sp.]|jgi:hypothetical protein|nr:hypothetical protein [Candidatus Paceibacter sp.]
MNKKVIYVSIAMVGIVVAGLMLYQKPKVPTTTNNTQVQSETKFTLVAQGKEYTGSLPNQSSAYDAMTKLASTTPFRFKAKYYAGMGYLIEEIEGIRGSDGAYWTLYINNATSTVGVSDYILKDNDTIEWKLEKM